MANVSYIGASNLIATNGTAPGAITPNASTVNGDLLIFYHYGRATGGNETVALTGWTQAFNTVTANQGHVAVFWRIRQSGDTSYTATVTNYTTGTSGETILEWIETYRNQAPTNPIASVTSTLSTWASSLNLGPISAPATATLQPEDMVVVFGGRFENITAQTLLTGDNLTWTARTRNDTTQGLDAGAVTQTGLNGTTQTQTVTSKTITTTGTAQTGAGIMFIIRSVREASITESTTSFDTVYIDNDFPQILSTTKGTTSGTSHTITLPNVVGGETLILYFGIDGINSANVSTANSTNYLSNPTGWTVIDSSSLTSHSGYILYRISDGTESNSNITITSEVVEEASYCLLRITKSIIIYQNNLSNSNSQTTTHSYPYNLNNGNVLGNWLYLQSFIFDANILPTNPSSGYQLVDSQVGGVNGASIYVQKFESVVSSGNTSFGASSVTTSSVADSISDFFALKAIPNSLYEANIPYGKFLPATSSPSYRQKAVEILDTTGYYDCIATKVIGSGNYIESVWVAFESYGVQSTGLGTANASRAVIFDSSGGAITNTVVASSPQSLPVTSSGIGQPCLINFTFTTPYQLQIGTSYYIGVETLQNNYSGYTSKIYTSDVFTLQGGITSYTSDTFIRVSSTQQWESSSFSLIGSGSLSQWSSYTFTRQPIILPLNSVSGGAIQSSVTEPTSATDLINSVANFPRLLSESSSATDEPNTTLSTSASVSESTSSASTENFTSSTISDSVSESASASDSPNGVGTFTLSLSESASATDGPNGTSTLITSLTETAPASDTIDATRSITVSLTERTLLADDVVDSSLLTSGSATESTSSNHTQSSILTLSSSASESASSSEEQTVLLSTGVSITESTGSSDNISSGLLIESGLTERTQRADEVADATLSTSDSVTESVTSSDSQSSTGTLASSITESVSSSDQASATKLAPASSSETISANDSGSSTLSTSASLTERTLRADDVVDGYYIFDVSSSETTSSSDTSSGSSIISVFVTEGASATDSFNGARTLTVSVSESSSALDLVSASSTLSVVVNEITSATDIYDAGYKGLYKFKSFYLHQVDLQQSVGNLHTIDLGQSVGMLHIIRQDPLSLGLHKINT